MLRKLAVWVLVGMLGAALSAWAGESAPSATPPEYVAPVAQVPTSVSGTVQSVTPERRTFTVVSAPRHRQPAQSAEIGVNKDTAFTLNTYLMADQLKVGDKVRVEPQRPAPYGVRLGAEGTVTSLAPLTIDVSKEIRLTLAPKAEVVFVRITPMKYEELKPGMNAQVTAYRATTPLLAKEVQVFTIAPSAAREMEAIQKQAPPAAGE